VSDQHQLRIGMGPAPLSEPLRALTQQFPRRYSIVPPPVIGQLEIIGTGNELQALTKPIRNLRVSVNRPNSWKQVDIVHEARRFDTITQLINFRIILCEHQIPNALPTAQKRTEHGCGGGSPHLTSVSLENTSRNPRDQYDDIGELTRHSQDTP
jgi:hypothetical protein